MSKVSVHSCPNCGAPLPNSERDPKFCPFCGTPIKIVPESVLEIEPRKFGYEFEKGRYDAQNSIPGSELANEIRKLIKPTEELALAYNRLDELEQKVQASEKEMQDSVTANLILMYGLPVVGFYFLYRVNVPVIAAIVSALLFFAVLRISITLRKKARTATYTDYKAKVEAASAHIDKLYDTYNFNLVPEEYLYREAMTYFVKVLSGGRAASLQQAINLYEDEKHRKKQIQIQQEQLALKQQEIDIQRQQLEDQKEFNAKKLELAQQKKGVDWGSVAAAAGAVAGVALSFKNKRK